LFTNLEKRPRGYLELTPIINNENTMMLKINLYERKMKNTGYFRDNFGLKKG